MTLCKVCGKDFPTSQALGGHKRLCKQNASLQSKTEPVNGKPDTIQCPLDTAIEAAKWRIGYLRELIARSGGQACFESRVKRLALEEFRLDELFQMQKLAK